MARLLLILMTFVALGLTAGCGGADEKPSAAPQAGATATPSTQPTPTPSETPTRTTQPKPAPLDLSGYDTPGFTTPSGNIGCLFENYQGSHVRCDRQDFASEPGGKPANCHLDWGHSVELSAGGRGVIACSGDTVMGQPGETDGTRVLPYGDSVRYRGIVCTSTTQGVRCSTSGGHGFLISRATIRVR